MIIFIAVAVVGLLAFASGVGFGVVDMYMTRNCPNVAYRTAIGKLSEWSFMLFFAITVFLCVSVIVAVIA
ncbi:TPA: hypothetical protein H1U84_004702 [Salmonella enterica]|nr:hypothetical protein [Salmonella enterica]